MADIVPVLVTADTDKRTTKTLMEFYHDYGMEQEFNNENAFKQTEDTIYNKQWVDRLWNGWMNVYNDLNGNPRISTLETLSDRAVRLFVIWIEAIMANQGQLSTAKALSNTVLINLFVELMNSSHLGFTESQEQSLQETLKKCSDELSNSGCHISKVHLC